MTHPIMDEGARVTTALESLSTAPQHQRPALEDTIVSACIARAHRLAHRYRRRGIDDDDLEQIAGVALVLAIRRYRPDEGAFWPFATVTITGELRRAFRDQAWLVRPTRSIQELRLRITARREELEQRTSRQPTARELAEDLNADVTTVDEALDASTCFRPDSLEAPAAGSEQPLGEGIGQEDPRYENLERWLSVVPGLRRLSDRERETLRLRFVDDLSQSQVGQRVGVSQMQISRDITRILGQLRAGVQPA